MIQEFFNVIFSFFIFQDLVMVNSFAFHIPAATVNQLFAEMLQAKTFVNIQDWSGYFAFDVLFQFNDTVGHHTFAPGLAKRDFFFKSGNPAVVVFSIGKKQLRQEIVYLLFYGFPVLPVIAIGNTIAYRYRYYNNKKQN